LSVFKQIHEIVFHGKGGFDWNTVYAMPLWLRKYTFHEIKMFYEEKSNAEKSAAAPNQTNLVDSKGNVNKSEFSQISNDYKGRTTYK